MIFIVHGLVVIRFENHGFVCHYESILSWLMMVSDVKVDISSVTQLTLTRGKGFNGCLAH